MIYKINPLKLFSINCFYLFFSIGRAKTDWSKVSFDWSNLKTRPSIPVKRKYPDYDVAEETHTSPSKRVKYDFAIMETQLQDRQQIIQQSNVKLLVKHIDLLRRLQITTLKNRLVHENMIIEEAQEDALCNDASPTDLHDICSQYFVDTDPDSLLDGW